MKLCVLNPSYEDSLSPTKDYDSYCDPCLFMEDHQCEMHFIKKSSAVEQVTALARNGFDVFVNLCDWARDEDRPGIEVVQILERLGVPFTGARSDFYEPTRQEMKAACAAQGVLAPRAVFASTEADVQRAAETLCFPLIVKHSNSYASIGLTPDSRVDDIQALFTQAWRMINRFGDALIEEFIDGREFTVLVAENPLDDREPVAYLPVEFCFPEGESFKHFDLKWIHYQGMSCIPCHDPILAERLKDLSRRVFKALNGSSYARCDIRMNANGDLYLLEINPNCGVFYPPAEAGSADFILMNDPAGHRGFLVQILHAALQRNRGTRDNHAA